MILKRWNTHPLPPPGVGGDSILGLHPYPSPQAPFGQERVAGGGLSARMHKSRFQNGGE
jgi:hypothetical protein